MATIGWDEASPSDGESASLGDDRIRSLKTSLRQGLDTEHVWPSAGGDSGVHRLGSARAYYGTQSAVSSSGTDGRIMVTSDTSRIFHVGSGGTMLLGGSRVISAGTTAGFTYPQRHHWVDEMGTAGTGSGYSVTITIPNSGFSGVPFTVVSAWTSSVNAGTQFGVVTQIDGASFIVTGFTPSGGGAYSPNFNFYWQSRGTRAL